MNGCIQIRLSLFVYDFYGKWTYFTDLHKETATEKELAAPIFTIKRNFCLANFDNELIFITGGLDDSCNSESDVFFYDIRSDKWGKAPSMNKARFHHSNTVLSASLYVYGGYLVNNSIKRMVNICSLMGECSTAYWETLMTA